MIKNYVKIAFRNLWKQRLFTAINVFGLASGLMVCLLAIAHIKGAFDYDHFHQNKDRIYRVVSDVINNENNRSIFATSPVPLAETLKKDYGFTERTARVIRTYGEVTGNEKKMNFMTFVADPDFFRVFSFPLARGQAAYDPGTAVISAKTAEKLFGKKNPIGQTLLQEGIAPSVITGVMPDTSLRSHLKFDILFSVAEDRMNQYAGERMWNEYNQSYTYVLLKPGTSADQFQKALTAISTRVKPLLDKNQVKTCDFQAQALSDISPSTVEMRNDTYQPQVTGLMVEMSVGLVTLLMAAFNYINLTLARSMSRAREVGIRKTSGALRWQLLGQFMAESVILSLLALCLAYLMLELVKPMPFVQQWLIGGVVWDWKLWGSFITFAIVAGLLAGVIPARVLSSFQPAEVLRSQTGLKVMRGISLRKSLIVLQFSISMMAMIALVTMIRQQNYMATGDYGFRSKGVLQIPLNGIPFERFAAKVGQLAGVEHISGVSEPFGHHGNTEKIKKEPGGQNATMAFTFGIGPEFSKTMGLTFLAGQEIKQTTVGNWALINEEAVRKFDLKTPGEAVGQTIWIGDSTQVQIAGVVKDFRFTSFAWAIKPLVLQQNTSAVRYIELAVTPGQEKNVLAGATAAWKSLEPYDAFAGQWVDDFLYERHSHLDDASFMGVLLGISFSIACLGLLGMVIYNTQTRIKEVGIRKVLGAQVRQIIWLLSRDFVKLLAIAATIAMPLGYTFGYAFLSSFAYHVSLGLETFALCAGVLLVLGISIICTKTYKVAIENPVKSLGTQ